MLRRHKTLVPLGETELEVLGHVWALGEATVADVHARIGADRTVAYTTVLTVMKNLEGKGYLASTRDGRQDRYRPARSAEAVRGSLLDGFVGRVFGGSPAALVQTLVGRESLSDAERDELRRLLDRL